MRLGNKEQQIMTNEEYVGYLENIRDMFIIGCERCEGDALKYQQRFISALNFAITYIKSNLEGKGRKTNTIKPEDVKQNSGDLISRTALKNALNYIYDCAYIDSKSKEGIASDIIAEIDKVPAVEYTFEEAFQKTVCEQRLYCPERPQGEWVMDNEHTKNPLLWYKCNLCGVYHSPTNYCPNCGAKMAGSDIPIKS